MEARDPSTAEKRLRQIWHDWSIEHAQDLKRAQRAALGGLVELLNQGGARVVLRAVQALMANPESSGVGKRALFDDLWASVEGHWEPGSSKEDVQQFQAMLLAAWPTGDLSDEYRLVSMIVPSLWEISRGRDVQKPALEKWLEASVSLEAGQAHTNAMPNDSETQWSKHLDGLGSAGETIRELVASFEEHKNRPQFNYVGGKRGNTG